MRNQTGATLDFQLRALDSNFGAWLPLKLTSNTSRIWRGCISPPDEEKKLGAQLGHILGYIEKLKELDVAGVEPTAHAVPMVNVTRADEIRPSLPHDDALRNAPKQANGLFIVPKIVE